MVLGDSLKFGELICFVPQHENIEFELEDPLQDESGAS